MGDIHVIKDQFVINSMMGSECTTLLYVTQETMPVDLYGMKKSKVYEEKSIDIAGK